MSVEPKRLESAQLLADLVTNTLDPGYRAATERRGPGAPRRWYDRALVAVGCLLIGFVAVTAYVHTNRGAPAAAKVHESLVSRVRSAEHGADGLAGRVDRLERQLAGIRNEALPQGGSLAKQLRRAQLATGELAVYGPGIIVTLREPNKATASLTAGRGGAIPIDATHILTDRDVRSVVNELWHDGAEAIEVNGVRLTPTSAIRFAGEAVLVDFQPITAPYRIRGIGNSDDLSTSFAQSSVASRYQTLVSVNGIGFSISDSQRLSLAAGAPANPHYATLSRPPSSRMPSAPARSRSGSPSPTRRRHSR